MGGGRRRPAVLVAALGLVALATAAACSAGGGGSNQSAAGDSAAQVPAQGGAAEKAPPGGAGDRAAPATPGQRVEQRSIIYTGSMSVLVENVDRAAADAISVVTAAGGYVGGDRRSGDGAATEAELQLRVPADRFSGVLDRIAALGKPERRDVSTEDVTEETIDLAARIATQRARVESGRRLLAQAKDLDQLISLEAEVARREADLASLEAKQRRLADLTALSTLTVTLRRLEHPASKADDQPIGFTAGLTAGWRGLVRTLAVLSTVLGALLPWLVTLGVPLAAVLWWWRRRRPAPAPVPAPAATAPAPAVPAGAAAGPAAPAPPAPRGPAPQ